MVGTTKSSRSGRSVVAHGTIGIVADHGVYYMAELVQKIVLLLSLSQSCLITRSHYVSYLVVYLYSVHDEETSDVPTLDLYSESNFGRLQSVLMKLMVCTSLKELEV